MILIFWFGVPILVCAMVCVAWLRYERTFPYRFFLYLLLFTALAFCSASAQLQPGAFYAGQATTVSRSVPFGQSSPIMTIPYARIVVCGYPAVNAGSICVNSIPVYSDSNLTQQITPPITADQLGNFSFWVRGGSYTYSVSDSRGNFIGTYPFTAAATMQGAQGAAGPQGPAGATGAQGPPGPSGTGYFQVAQNNGSGSYQQNAYSFQSPLSFNNNTGANRVEIGLSNSGVSPGSYTYPNLTVNQFGIITAASNGSVPASPVQSANLNGQTCTTGSNTYSACPVTVPLHTAYVDNNYDVTCSGVGPSDNRAYLQILSVTPSQINLQVVTNGSVGVYWSDVNCITKHR